MVDADDMSLYWRTHSKVGWLGLRTGGQLILSLHSSNQLVQLSQ